MKRTLSGLTALALATALVFSFTPDASAKTKHRNRINRRQAHQEKRIKEGERSGQLTKGEAKELKGDEKAINKQVKEERKANGGHLTKEERKQTHQELNQESKKIDELKHNDQTK